MLMFPLARRITSLDAYARLKSNLNLIEMRAKNEIPNLAIEAYSAFSRLIAGHGWKLGMQPR